MPVTISRTFARSGGSGLPLRRAGLRADPPAVLMDLWIVLKAALLGVIEGLTEFLPVSSTGHLIIAGHLMDFTGERANTFEIFIQFGAILGVVWYYRRRLASLVTHLRRRSERGFAGNLLIAFLPAAIIGAFAHDAITTYLFGPRTVAAALVLGGVAILVIERRPRVDRVTRLEKVGALDALKIGIAQTVSLFPGVSRAGATIMGGLLTGLSRTAATEFSFFLAIPTMFAATLYSLARSLPNLRADDSWLFAAGFVTAFLTALVVVRLFLVYVGRHTFASFAWYRIGFGLLVLVYFW
jgi:undecaprenyl-diphosphatase